MGMATDYTASLNAENQSFHTFKKKKKTISQHKMFSSTQISLLKAKTGDTSRPVYKRLWALFVPRSVKEANLVPGGSPTQDPFSHTK